MRSSGTVLPRFISASGNLRAAFVTRFVLGRRKRSSMEKAAHVVSRSDTLQNVYCCGIVGSYGGGDSNQVARQYLALSVPFPTSQSALGSKLVHMKEEIWKHTVTAFEQERAKGAERVVRIPETLVHKDSIEWDLALQISSHLKVSRISLWLDTESSCQGCNAL